MRIYCVSFTDAEGVCCEMCYPANTAEKAVEMCESDFDGIIVTNIEEVK